MIQTDNPEEKLNKSLMERQEIACSEGSIHHFPDILTRPYRVSGVGIVVCLDGRFRFSIGDKELEAHAGQTLFVPSEETFCVLEQSADLRVSLLFYEVENIRDIVSNAVSAMRFYSIALANPGYVWNTGDEDDLLHYIQLLHGMQQDKADHFGHYERQLLLLALTHRLCAIYHHHMLESHTGGTGHKHETFVRLIRLIDQHYTTQRGVDFYADKLCLSAKYLSTLCKSVCGYTVQELVFKSIIRKSISLLKNTEMTIQEISDYFNFPNASYFGTFFKKQMGVSPQNYRE